MVITNLIGGLGNQMFQYAAGRALSLERNVSLRLDISGFENYGLHQGFELQRVFNCPAEIASEADVRGILGWQYSSSIRQLLSRPSMAAFRREELVVESHFHYWQEIKNVPNDCYLTGYWQSEKYFLEVTTQMRGDFSFRLPLENQNAELAKQINQVNAVSLHVRRGDYAHNPKTTETHGLCSLDYYQAAIQYVSERVTPPHFFVFSDDISWVKSNLKIDFPCEYVDHNHRAESYNDMLLMSMCQHHIIANSSFSWWGAWLNPSGEKIVVAPKHWFANQTDIQDLLPQGWVTQ
jgi:hypothetical protein